MEGGGGGDGGGGSGGGGGGGDNQVSQALNLLRQGARLYKEVGSRDVDEEEAEQEFLIEEALEQQEKANKKNKGKEDKSKQKEEEQEDSASTSNNRFNASSNATKANNNTRPTLPLNMTPEALMENVVQPKLDAFQARAKKTRIVLLRKLAAWAFDVTCESDQPQKDGNGTKDCRIDVAQFYTGVLLVHLNLAKYVGVAACHPPTRDQITELFYLADADRSGSLNRQEFTNAVVVACTPITSRIGIYWSLLAVLPFIVGRCMGGLTKVLHQQIATLPSGWTTKALAIVEWMLEHVMSILFFSILVPNIFGRIDAATRRYARQRSNRRQGPSTNLWWLRIQQQIVPPTALEETSNFAAASWNAWFDSMRQSVFRVSGNKQGGGSYKGDNGKDKDDERSRHQSDDDDRRDKGDHGDGDGGNLQESSQPSNLQKSNQSAWSWKRIFGLR